MKAIQRNALTRERQARLATGGGPEVNTPEIDPDVSLVAPNLLEMAPVLFSSDLSEVEVTERRQNIRDNPDQLSTDVIMTFEEEEDTGNLQNKSTIDEAYTLENDTEVITEECRNTESEQIFLTDVQPTPGTSQQTDTSLLLKNPVFVEKKNRQRTKSNDVRRKSLESNSLEQLRIQRVEELTNKDVQISEIKLEREKNLLAHEMAVQQLTLEHMKRMHDLEQREMEAKIQLINLQLLKQRSNSN